MHRQVYEMATTANSLALTRYAPCLAHNKKGSGFMPDPFLYVPNLLSYLTHTFGSQDMPGRSC